MITFNSVVDLTSAHLVIGDIILLLGEAEQGDSTGFFGIVRPAGFVSIHNRTEIIANGLVVELLPKSEQIDKGSIGPKKHFSFENTTGATELTFNMIVEAADVFIDGRYYAPAKYTITQDHVAITSTITFLNPIPAHQPIEVDVYLVKSIALGVQFKGSARLNEILARPNNQIGDIWISESEGTIPLPAGGTKEITVNEGIVWTYAFDNNFLGWVSIGLLRGPQGVPGEGIPGPKGEQGIQGIRGPQGIQGATGPQGQDGPKGEQGAEGPEGQRGEQGPIGQTPAHQWSGSRIRFMQTTGEWGSWVDIAGPQGVQGPQGVVGPTGPEGAIGPQGPQGVAGPRGPIGPTGSQGPIGPKGDKGNTGPTGPQGVQGNVGLPPEHVWTNTQLRFKQPDGTWGPYVNLQGVQGPRGIQGERGLNGQDGLNFKFQGSKPLNEIVAIPAPNVGDLWVSTTNGTLAGTKQNVVAGDNIVFTQEDGWFNIGPFKGEQGPPGPMGPRGPEGEQGIRGQQGEQGPTGQQGLKGPQGEIGPQGLKGDKGDTGDRGQKGPQGDIGLTGPQGSTGPTGAQGPQGKIGPQGIKGPQGEQGLRGPEGPQGKEGPAGIQGPEGKRGEQGIAGPQGLQGPEGIRGPIGLQGPEGPQGRPGPIGAQGPTGNQGPKGDQGSRGPEGPRGSSGAGWYTLAWAGLTLDRYPPSAEVTSKFITAYGRAPQVDDTLTIYNPSNVSIAHTRRYSGTAWIEAELYIHGDMILKGTLIADRVAANISISSPNIVGGNLNIGSGKFVVNNDGSFTATQANITGVVNASSGSFTGSIHVTGDSTIDGTVTGGIISGATVQGGEIKVGGDLNNPNFKVDRNGNLYANNGTFAGDIYAGKLLGTPMGYAGYSGVKKMQWGDVSTAASWTKLARYTIDNDPYNDRSVVIAPVYCVNIWAPWAVPAGKGYPGQATGVAANIDFRTARIGNITNYRENRYTGAPCVFITASADAAVGVKGAKGGGVLAGGCSFNIPKNSGTVTIDVEINLNAFPAGTSRERHLDCIPGDIQVFVQKPGLNVTIF